MTLLEELKTFDQDYNLWYDKTEEESDTFLNALVADAKENLAIYQNHCKLVNEENETSVGVIYEALSYCSEDHFDFLQKEIELKTRQLQNGEMDADVYDVLEFDYEKMAEKAPTVYMDCLDFLSRNLFPRQTNEVNLAIIQVLNWASLDFDPEIHANGIRRIQSRILNDFPTYSILVRKELAAYLTNTLEMKDAPKLSLIEKIQCFLIKLFSN